MATTRHFSIKLVRSGAGQSDTTRRTLAGLNLTRTQRTVFLKDTAPIRGMIYKVIHLVEVGTHAGAPPASARARARHHKAATAKKSKG